MDTIPALLTILPVPQHTVGAAQMTDQQTYGQMEETFQCYTQQLHAELACSPSRFACPVSVPEAFGQRTNTRHQTRVEVIPGAITDLSN